MNLGTLIVRIDGDMSGLTNSLNRAGKAMTKTGKTMTASITLPIVAASTAAFNLYKGFESSMSKISGLVGVAKNQVDQWSKEILKIAPALGKAPEELADALFFVTSAGIKGAEAMEVLKSSAQASAAGLGETKIVADLVTSAMNAYGTANLSATKATDILVAAVREGKAEASSLAAALGTVLPIASEMNVSFDQVGAAVAAMTRTGTEANTASMQLKNILASLLKPTDQAADALATMGTSAGQLRGMIKEKGLIKTLASLREMTNQYGEDAMAKVFPNIRALSGVLDLMGKNAGDNIAIFERMEDATGSLNDAFMSASETAQFKWDQAMSSVKSTLTTLGETIAVAVVPIINKFAVLMQDVANWFNALNQAQKESVIKWAAVAAAIGPVILVIGGLTTAISALGAAFAFLTSPIGLVVAAIAALAAGVLYVWDNWAAIKERISDISWWKNAILDMVSFLIEYSPMGIMMKGINAIIEKFGGDPIPDPFEGIADTLKGLKDETKEYEHEFGSFTDAMKNGISEVTSLFDGFGEMGGGAGSAIAPLVPTEDQTKQIQSFAVAWDSWDPPELEEVLEITDAFVPTEEELARMTLFTDEIAWMSQGITNAVNGAMVDAGIGIGEMLGNFAAGAKGVTSLGGLVKGLGVVVLEAVAGLAKSIGIMALESGVALMAIKIGLTSLNPGVMIAAGVALIALSSMVSSKAKGMGDAMQNSGGDGGASKLQGLATGGTVTKGGAFMVGEAGPELVTLAAGSAVTPNHALGGNMEEQLIAQISGEMIEIVLQRWGVEKNRMT